MALPDSLWQLFGRVWEYHHLSGLDTRIYFLFWSPWNCCIYQEVGFCLKEMDLSVCPFSFYHFKQVCDVSFSGCLTERVPFSQCCLDYLPVGRFRRAHIIRSVHRLCEWGMPLGTGAFPSCSSQECPHDGSISSTSLIPGRCRDETILFLRWNQSGWWENSPLKWLRTYVFGVKRDTID